MGAYLSTPITEKDSSEGESELFKYGITAMQGWRTEMEDAHAAVLDVDSQKTGYFAVFDGHGGKEVAKFSAKYLAEELVKSEAWKRGELGSALTDTYLKIDEILVQEGNRTELQEMAGGDSDKGNMDRNYQQMMLNEDELPDYVKEALVAQVRAQSERQGGSNNDEDDWGGDECEDPDFDPLVDLDDADPHGGKVSDTDFAIKDSDSEEDDEDETSDDNGPQEMSEESGDENGDKGEAEEGEPPQFVNGSVASEQREYRGPTAGCTAVVAVVRGDTLVVANAGDSRCVCSRNGTAVAMTQDHKPTDAEEHARITKAGGFIADGRVNGSLNLSRALGDMEYKRSKDLPPQQQMVTADPEIRTLKLEKGDEFLILACDGIWDVLTNQEAVDFVRTRLQRGMEPRAICEAMCDECLAPDTEGCGKGCDNMSAMVVVLKSFAHFDGSGQGATPIPPPMPAANTAS